MFHFLGVYFLFMGVIPQFSLPLKVCGKNTDEVANKKELSSAPLVTSRCEGAMQAALLVFYPGFFVLTCVGAQVSDFQPYLLFEQIQ